MKFFACQPDSHNGFGALTNGTLSYFTVVCQSAPHTLADSRGAQSPKSDAGGEPHSQKGSLPNNSFSGIDNQTRVRVQKFITLPGVFHTQSTCFSMANRSVFGMDLAFIGSSNGVLALVVLADKSLVYAPERDPQTVRDSLQHLLRSSQQNTQRRYPTRATLAEGAPGGVSLSDRPNAFGGAVSNANAVFFAAPPLSSESDLLPHETMLDAPSTVTCMRDQPLVFVGYMSGRIEWYQISISPIKQRQYGEFSMEAPYEMVLASHFPKHLTHVDQHSHVSRVYAHGEGDGVRMTVLARCELPESGPLVTSDYFPANAHLVVGSVRMLAVFSSRQLECPLYRLPHVGCSFLYCHPCLPVIGTLMSSWNLAGAWGGRGGGSPTGASEKVWGNAEKDASKKDWGEEAKGASGPEEVPHPTPVLYDSPNGLNGGCLLRIFEVVELPGPPMASCAASSKKQPLSGQALRSNSFLKSGTTAGGSNEETTTEGAVVVEPATMPQHRSATKSTTFGLQQVQERLYPISSKQYGTYFSFSWKFSLDLELALCNIEEGVAYIVRLHQQCLPQQREPSVKKAPGHLGRDMTTSDANVVGDCLVPSLKYAFTSEHRVELSLHSLLNVEYVSAATIALNAIASRAASSSSGHAKQGPVGKTASHGSEAGGKDASLLFRSPTAVSGSHAAQLRRTAANQTGLQDGARRTSGGLGYANAAQRFAALFRSQDNCTNGGYSAGEHTIGGDVDPETEDNNVEPFFLTRKMMDSISYSCSIRACGWAWEASNTFFHLRTSGALTPPPNFPIGVNSWGIQRPTPTVYPREEKLTLKLLNHSSTTAGIVSKGVRSSLVDAKKTSLTFTLTTERQRQHSALGSAERPPNRHDSHVNSYTRCGNQTKDTPPPLRIGAGSITNLVGLNQAGEIICIPIECEAIVTWHEEGSVFASLGSTLYSVDVLSLQDIEREIKQRAHGGFGLSAQENVAVLRKILENKKKPAAYRGASVPPSAQSLTAPSEDNPMLQHTKDIEKLFTYVALLEQAGIAQATGDVLSVLSLLEMEGGLSGVVEDGPSRSNLSADFERIDSRKRLLLHVLDWLPSTAYLSNAFSLANSATTPQVFHTQEELEREVAIQVLHGCFETGAALLELSHRNASFSSAMWYSSIVNLLRNPAQTVGLIRGSNPTARDTFLTSLSPWLLAVFLHLCADREDTQESRSYRAQIYVDMHLSLWDRVAMATLLEPDYLHLIQVLRQYMLPTCSLVQALMLEHGISQKSFSKMQHIVDCTGDFQLGACLYARVGVRLMLPNRVVDDSAPANAREVHERKAVPQERGLACSFEHPYLSDFVSFDTTMTSPPTAMAAAFSCNNEGALSQSGLLLPSQIYSSVLPPPPPRWGCDGCPHSEVLAPPKSLSKDSYQEGASSVGQPLPMLSIVNSHPEGKETTALTLDGDEEAAVDNDDDHDRNNWLWWTEAYRAFLDNEQAFVERTMFDVACQRLHEQYLTSLSLSPIESSSWPLKGSSGGGACLNRTQGLTNEVGVHGIPAPSLPMLPNSPILAPIEASPLFPGAVYNSTLQHVRSLAKILSTSPVADIPGGAASDSMLCSSADPTDRDGRECDPHGLLLPPQLQTLAFAVCNQPLRCSVCLRPVSLHQQDVEQSLAWCTACAHGGHAHHLREWFATHRVCAVEGCGCHCN